MIPILETSRLVLRGHRADDFAACAEMWADPEVVRFIGGVPSTGEQAWARLLRYAGHWALLGFGFWVIVERATGRFAGELGLADFKRDLDPPIGELETGWVLQRWAHGRGFATEALGAVLAWSDARFPDRATACVIEPDNAASIRVARKCGYLEVARTVYHGDPIVVYRRSPSGAPPDHSAAQT
jgi:RimJ/RimL family protein N-acetyltransferase